MTDNWANDIKRLADNDVRKAPEGLLDDVKSEMLRRGLMPAQQQTRIVTMHKWRYAAAAAVVAIVAGVAITTFHKEEAAGGIAGTSQSGSSTPYHNNSTPYYNNVDNNTMADASVSESSAGNIVERAISGAIQRAAIADTAYRQLVAAAETQTQEKDSARLVAQADTREEAETPQHTYHSVGSTRSDYTDFTPRKSRSSAWSVGAYYGGSANNSPTANTPVLFAQYDDCCMSTPVKIENKNQIQVEEIGDTKESHHQTVKVGVSLRYNLSDRWNLQTGVTYTRLTSDFTEEKSTSNVVTNQKLDYIGIPLTASYNIWQNKYINVYASVGGAVEKLINGASTTETKNYTDDKTTRSNNDVRENRPVFSTSIAAGIEYNVSDFLSIYAQPGLTCHFDNGSGIKSLYTDKPVNVELSIGARININK